MNNSPKIVLLGTGSMVFSKNVIADILWHEALAGSDSAGSSKVSGLGVLQDGRKTVKVVARVTAEGRDHVYRHVELPVILPAAQMILNGIRLSLASRRRVEG